VLSTDFGDSPCTNLTHYPCQFGFQDLQDLFDTRLAESR
jgi:hypothetical protein